MKKQTVAIIALVIAQIFWGASYLLSDYALKVFSPAMLVTMRITIAAIVLGIIGAATGQLQRVKLKDAKYFLLASFAEPFIYFLCEAEALNHLSPTIVSVILSFIPLLTPVFAFIVLREKVTIMNILGIVVSVLGVMMIIFDGGKLTADIAGIVLLFIGVLASITYTLVLRKVPEEYNTLTVVFYMFCTSLLFFIPTTLIKEMPEVMSVNWSEEMTHTALYSVIGLALSASCIAFLFFSFGVRTIGPTRANVFNNIQPGVTAILAWILIGDALNLSQTTGIAIVIIGMFVSQTKINKKKKKLKN